MSGVRNQESRPLQRAFRTANIAAPLNYVGRAPQTTNPFAVTTPTSVVLSDAPGKVIPGRVRIFPFATASANDTLVMRLWGWSREGNDQPGSIIWIPFVLLEINVTIGAIPGVAGAPLPAGDRLADTITLVATTGEPTTAAATTPRGTTEVYSPANDTPAYVELRIPGCEQLDFEFKQGGVGAPSANAYLLFLAENH